MSVDAAKVAEFKRLHTEAMKLANDGFTYRYLGQPEKAAEALRSAWPLERDAAMMLVDEKDLEPSRSIAFHSAASLAQLCGETADARRLANLGLDGSPTARVRRGLEVILAQAGEPTPWPVASERLVGWEVMSDLGSTARAAADSHRRLVDEATVEVLRTGEPARVRTLVEIDGSELFAVVTTVRLVDGVIVLETP